MEETLQLMNQFPFYLFREIPVIMGLAFAVVSVASISIGTSAILLKKLCVTNHDYSGGNGFKSVSCIHGLIL
jgi:peptidoglycan/LPS O-acetylase OafA/YrhL